MIAPNYSKLCTEAEHYYLDFLLDETAASIPNETIDHIMGCTHCREQMSRLEEMLTSQTNPAQQPKAVTALLKLHLSYADKKVTCADVRPFLPSLLNPALRIEIPTPITVHVDKCKQCQENLGELRGLDLGQKNLTTLGRMFADDFAADEVECSAARAAIPSIVAMAFNQTDAKTLRHLCLCPQCREKLYNFRQMIRQQTALRYDEGKAESMQLFCQSVKLNDIFDYCIPYGIDPASDEYEKFRKSLTSHIIGCTDCLGKLQQLHKTIYSIIDKPESDVATVFHLDTSAKIVSLADSENPYAGFPIRVETVNSRSMQAGVNMPGIEKPVMPIKLHSVSKNLRPLFKVALPVAAMLVIGFSLLLKAPLAKALSIAQIQNAVFKVRNVYIANFSPGKREPTSRQWVSRSLDVYMVSARGEQVVWDLGRGTRKNINSQTDRTSQDNLSPEEVAKMETMISGSFGMMPFENISVLPENAQWTQLANANLPGEISVLEVYDLQWFDKSSSVNNKWRVYVDPATRLPQRTEFYRILPGEQEYTLESYTVIEYPNDNEIQTIIEKLSF